MNQRLPMLKYRDILKALQNCGFFVVRQKGSHTFLKHSDGRFVVVPFHGNADIGRGLLRQILREANISPIEFRNLLK
jgi:predicted RNA binding protein YcfA (HicA-like mRNA interferase family)